jgi:hypothetical protein
MSVEQAEMSVEQRPNVAIAFQGLVAAAMDARGATINAELAAVLAKAAASSAITAANNAIAASDSAFAAAESASSAASAAWQAAADATEEFCMDSDDGAVPGGTGSSSSSGTDNGSFVVFVSDTIGGNSSEVEGTNSVTVNSWSNGGDSEGAQS